MSYGGYHTIPFTFYDPQVNRYYSVHVSSHDAIRIQTDSKFATETFYRIKNIQDALPHYGVTSVRSFSQLRTNGQIHGVPNQTIVHLPANGSIQRWFTCYPTPRYTVPINAHSAKKYSSFIRF